MWAAVKKKVGLFIGFPDLNASEDEYFAHRLVEFCKKYGKKSVMIDIFVQHHHRSSLRGFIKQRMKYGESIIRERILVGDYKLLAALAGLPILFFFFLFLLPKFMWLYIVALIVGYSLTKLKLWGWIYKNWGKSVCLGCVVLSYLGGLVSLVFMYYGLIKLRKVKIWREDMSCDFS